MDFDQDLDRECTLFLDVAWLESCHFVAILGWSKPRHIHSCIGVKTTCRDVAYVFVDSWTRHNSVIQSEVQWTLSVIFTSVLLLSDSCPDVCSDLQNFVVFVSLKQCANYLRKNKRLSNRQPGCNFWLSIRTFGFHSPRVALLLWVS